MCNIEISHIHSDEELSDTHHRAVLKMKELGVSNGVISVMVDDYHPKTFTLDLPSFIEKLESFHNIKIAMVVYESSLTSNSEKLIQSIPKEMIKIDSFDHSTRFVTFLNVGGTKIALRELCSDGSVFYRCAVLTAAWQLTRLGVFDFDLNFVKRYNDLPIYSKKVISIIDKCYKDNEMKSLKIIEVSPHKNQLENIRHEFV